MTTFLCFRLHGPLASWGDIAVGERRPSAPHPTRSALLGLVGAAVGVRREDSDAWAVLDRGVGMASRTDASGHLLTDYHTAQGPDEVLLNASARLAKKQGKAWHRPATRREEMGFARRALSTVLSSRQYRVDAVWTAALWLRPKASVTRWSLEDLVEALKRPRFLPYLGRKSCPLDVPMEPQLIEAAQPVEAMSRAVFNSDEVLRSLLDGSPLEMTVRWEGVWPGLVAAQTVRRRDGILSRARWQFSEREEHQTTWNPKEGGGDVSEQG